MSDVSTSKDTNPETIKPADEHLRFSTKLAYGAGDLGTAISANVMIFFLLFFLTNVAGLSPGLASLVLAVGKVWDAINDPITGILSDRTRTRWGRRIPWMLAGAIPFGLFYCLLWIVPRFSENVTTNEWLLFAYYVTIAIGFHLAYTVVNLPYTTLTPELTRDYNERTRLNSFRMAFSIGGSIFSLILAQIVFLLYPDDSFTQFRVLGTACAMIAVLSTLWCVLRIQERGMEPLIPLEKRQQWGWISLWIGGACGLYGFSILFFNTLKSLLVYLGNDPIFIIFLRSFDFNVINGILLCILFIVAGLTLIDSVPEEYLTIQTNSEETQTNAFPTLNLREQFQIALSTKPFLYLIGIYLCSWLAVQLTASILIYFVVSWMGFTEASFPLTAIAVQGTALIMLFVWQQVSNKLGKKKVYFMGTFLWLIAQSGLFFLQPGQVLLMYGLAILAGTGVSVAYLIPWSMVPDIIELDELKTGQRREGIFYGFMVLLQKLCLAFSLFIVGQTLEWAGFIKQVPGEPIPIQPDSALFAIRVAIGPLPMLMLIIGLILAYFYPITQEVHQEIRLQLLERKQSEQSS
ncbi:MFS transporter [Spirulina subsalsa FACHB-351]|uniref:MFS transporter n=1 Tax=Spirulina subsalsa FACHB-351 TaxID=234711 RepID=A0ABT3L3U0_9CYAN|nr:MFS transporter [Spirulina subsalsa]MCW6036135.1 MFS transporter [Spirulina subsalsa FACHB-351]